MKYRKLILATALVLGIAQVSNGQGITGSKHDFSSAAWNNNTPITTALRGEKCRPCHAPHFTNNTTAGTNAPLWGHAMSTASYTPYTGYDMNASVGQPDGSTKLCLSCHDGTVALANFRQLFATGTAYYTTATTKIDSIGTGVSNLGTNISNDHPVSFVYDALLASADGGLYDPTTTSSGIAGGTTIDADMLEKGTHKVQCISCHDAHNGAGGNHLLIKANTASALCYTCHNK